MSFARNGRSEKSKSKFGLWVYLMTDCMLFACLFATYAVLRHNTAGGPAGSDIFDLNFVLIETILLLISSFTIGMSVIAAKEKKIHSSALWLAVTLCLGMIFISMEIYEFKELIQAGHSWRRSAFLSAFFTLVGTHGVHIIVGLIWGFILLTKSGKNNSSQRFKKQLALMGIYWHFLDVIWIFIFTYVYLMGVIK